MKKILCTLLIAVLMLPSAGCRDGQGPTPATISKTTVTTATSTALTASTTAATTVTTTTAQKPTTTTTTQKPTTTTTTQKPTTTTTTKKPRTTTTTKKPTTTTTTKKPRTTTTTKKPPTTATTTTAQKPTTTTTTKKPPTTATTHEHRLGDWEVEEYPTCQREGTDVRICDDCGFVVEERITPRLAHNFEDDICTYCFGVNLDGTAVQSLGNPYLGIYGANSNACVAWDLYFHDGLLHRGAGDYDRNTGSMIMWAYDTITEAWVCTGMTSDEEISRFVEIDGALYAPGTDAVGGDWSLGNYYRLDEAEWTKFHAIPDGVHVWDIAKYDGKLFFALGVNPAARATPLVYTVDGKNYTFAPLYKNGVLNDNVSGVTTIRAYELYSCGGSLFAYVVAYTQSGWPKIETYRFEKDKFVYVADAPEFDMGANNTYRQFTGDGEFGGATYLVQNYLYRTTDGANFTQVTMPHNEFVADMLIRDGTMRVLTYKRRSTEKKEYEIVIYDMKNGTPTEEYRFENELPPIALEHDGTYFYVALGRASGEDNRNGTILRIKP